MHLSPRHSSARLVSVTLLATRYMFVYIYVTYKFMRAHTRRRARARNIISNSYFNQTNVTFWRVA